MAQSIQVSPQLPAAVQKALAQVGKAAFDEFSKGVVSSFGVISYRGKTWRIRKSGEEQPYLDQNGDAVQSIEVVLVKSIEQLSKIHYDKRYSEGDESQPRCWSANGIKPDQSVQNPIHSNCAACPNNVWGSRITEDGKKARACSDVRRMAVVFKHHLEEAAAGFEPPPVMLLRVPPASLNPLKDFVEKMLLPKGIPPFCIVTRVGFDTSVAYPKLTFKGTRFLNEREAEIVMELRESDEVRRILAESIENEEAGTPDASQAAAGPTTQPSAEAKAAAPAASPSKPKLRPAEEEELNATAAETIDDIAPAPPVSGEESDGEEGSGEGEIAAAPPAPAPAKAKGSGGRKASSKKAAAPAAPAQEPEGDGEGAFEDMLSSILGS